MNDRNGSTAPFVVSARVAADIRRDSRVLMLASVTVATSWARCRRRRSSLLSRITRGTTTSRAVIASPIAQEPPRHQLCYGVWGVVGSTARWPEVVNMWEHDGFDGIALSLGHETGRPQLQDEKLEKWWSEAANYRRGGYDRLLLPAPWT